MPTTFAPACWHNSINPFAACPFAKKSSIINTVSSEDKNFLEIDTWLVTCLVRNRPMRSTTLRPSSDSLLFEQRSLVPATFLQYKVLVRSLKLRWSLLWWSHFLEIVLQNCTDFSHQLIIHLVGQKLVHFENPSPKTFPCVLIRSTNLSILALLVPFYSILKKTLFCQSKKVSNRHDFYL